jgi:serine/threonine protein kinase
MTPERWKQIQEIFSAAMDELDATLREALIQERCGVDENLLREVRDLIAYDAPIVDLPDRAGALSAAFFRLLSELSENASEPDWVGRRTVDGYKLQERIGCGGFGYVYSAAKELNDSFRVAIKILIHVDQEEDFLREVRNLEAVRDDHVVRVLNFDTDVFGCNEWFPFIVTELVTGAQDIVEYAELRKLSVEKRVALFCDAVSGVAAAHKKSILHCDLKPANILVSPEGMVKVVDFGLAQRFSAAATGPMTTPVWISRNYASPEHANQERMSLESDVYSLGCVLYELLTGFVPINYYYCVETEQPALRKEHRIIPLREVSPYLECAYLGDLEAILQKALAHEPLARYQSALNLEADLKAWLKEKPVEARRQQKIYWPYRLGKAIYRNPIRVPFFVLLIVAISLFAFRLNTTNNRARDFESRLGTVTNHLLNTADELTDIPGTDWVRRNILAKTMAELEALSNQAPDSLAQKRLLAAAFYRVSLALANNRSSSNEYHAMSEYALKAIRLAEAVSRESHDLYDVGVMIDQCLKLDNFYYYNPEFLAPCEWASVRWKELSRENNSYSYVNSLRGAGLAARLARRTDHSMNLLEDASYAVGEGLNRNPNDENLDWADAWLAMTGAKILNENGRVEAAISTFESAAEFARNRATQSAEWKLHLVRLLQEYTETLCDWDQYSKADTIVDELLTLLIEHDGSSLKGTWLNARTFNLASKSRAARNRTGEAHHFALKAEALYARIYESDPGNALWGRQRVDQLASLATIQLKVAASPRAIETLLLEDRVFQEICQRNPEECSWIENSRSLLSNTLSGLNDLQKRQLSPLKATPASQSKSSYTFESLEDPLLSKARDLMNRARNTESENNPAKTAAFRSEALDRLDEVYAKDEQNLSVARELLLGYVDYFKDTRGAADRKKIQIELDTAVALADNLQAEHPSIPMFRPISLLLHSMKSGVVGDNRGALVAAERFRTILPSSFINDAPDDSTTTSWVSALARKLTNRAFALPIPPPRPDLLVSPSSLLSSKFAPFPGDWVKTLIMESSRDRDNIESLLQVMGPYAVDVANLNCPAEVAEPTAVTKAIESAESFWRQGDRRPLVQNAITIGRLSRFVIGSCRKPGVPLSSLADAIRFVNNNGVATEEALFLLSIVRRVLATTGHFDSAQATNAIVLNALKGKAFYSLNHLRLYLYNLEYSSLLMRSGAVNDAFQTARLTLSWRKENRGSERPEFIGPMDITYSAVMLGLGRLDDATSHLRLALKEPFWKGSLGAALDATNKSTWCVTLLANKQSFNDLSTRLLPSERVVFTEVMERCEGVKK